MKKIIKQPSFLRNKQANISILAILLLNIILFQILYLKTITIESAMYTKHHLKNYNLFALENLIITLIYQDYNNVNLNRKNLNITSNSKVVDENYALEISIIINQHKLQYYALYDVECNQVLEFYQKANQSL